MVSSGRSGRFACTVVFWQWALGISVGAACAGAVFVVGSQHVATRVAVTEPGLAGAASPIEATGVASIGGTPLTTASLDLPIIPSAEPPVMLPPDKPVLKPRSAISKVFRVRETPADVAHFDSCLPSCETRDPLVAGVDAPAAPLGTLPVASVPGTSMPAPSMSVAPAPVASALPDGPVPPLPLLDPVGGEPIPMAPQRGPVDLAVDSGKALVKGVEATSGAVVKGTRRAVDAAVDLLW
ncbi:hypothetical protein ANOBCDAF_03993 [Pleomorphomonas sp. T1.2MG-36]|uniref:hypothetical protein n=1 Tax=Pleomorphomonas sp. T1.2MG-36 TaxID=3041167 RepID=UPI002477ACAF|nr:hypothetical protein [Pleomorphomonas sp. T1.2MG-36]CAI9417492.1 hypothetical protein ANOBCDAF_03993 [Pleomorphomonas sp. T1.2MG-36]